MQIPVFDRRFFDARERFTRIGDGSVGGKAAGLLVMKDHVASAFSRKDGSGRTGDRDTVAIDVPTLTVITTEAFDRFMTQNDLRQALAPGTPDERIALAFQQAALPPDLLGDLRALVAQVHAPLAVRSSSLLEDALHEPFAGVYATKMIPNNQPDADSRFRRLVEAVKFVYASTYFAAARAYRRTTGHEDDDEQMAVIVQEIVGRRHGDRFYPDLSGVARSYSFYRAGGVRPEEGVVSLALGLGRTIVDEGVGWSYSPARPSAPPPFGAGDALLERTQTRFWAVNMGRPPAYDPVRETEYLVQLDLSAAEMDGTLRHVASTYDAASDRLVPGIGRPGARVLDFAPLLALRAWPVNDAIKALLESCERAVGRDVEIEFAATLDDRTGEARIGFLQVRPMTVSSEVVDITDEETAGPGVLAWTNAALGNGIRRDVSDIVYVRPERFDRARTREIAEELSAINARLVEDGRRYLLIGFGRWGSSDRWLGIPVDWSHISGAGGIVEATLPGVGIELSQGSHLFQNISSAGVSYLSVATERGQTIDWAWLDRQPAVAETASVRHVRPAGGIVIKVDGRTGRGLVIRAPES
jgi:hypothetical protein